MREQVGLSDFQNANVDSGIRGQKPSFFTLQLLARNLIALFSRGRRKSWHEKNGKWRKGVGATSKKSILENNGCDLFQVHGHPSHMRALPGLSRRGES